MSGTEEAGQQTVSGFPNWVGGRLPVVFGSLGWMWVLALVFPVAAWGSGPRYVTGYPYFSVSPGRPIGWKQSGLTYFTDPGGMSASVNHAAADAMVAAAAGVWNVPVASISISQGGGLAEHVSGANVYLGTEGMVWPGDVGKGNSAAVPIAVVYDSDGSVTDLLLGGGASSPGSCLQNGVTESVDQFDTAGYIEHAIIVINGRCTGAASQKQLQLQYQLERVFGRVLGLAWSQANDNVFTGNPQPTYDQALHWPIMHPLDILCGQYSYQCLPNPFQLRDDDIASLVLVYPVGQSGAGPGKQYSLADAEGAYGWVGFPTGEGMAGVNVLAQRQGDQNHVLEGWIEGSAVSGTGFRRNGTSPFVAADATANGSQGTMDQGQEGIYFLAYMPMQSGTTVQTVVISTEPVNPLYIGTYSVEPYTAGVVAPSGSAPVPATIFQGTANGNVYANFTVADAASGCGSGLDGTLAAPAQAAASGWWNGLICGYGHVAYAGLDVKTGRSLTVEVTALDEQGLSTTGKMMPVMGIYAPTDAPWDLPSVAVTGGAFNALGLGTTSLKAQTGALTQLTVGIADQRGDGRPDFAYQARVFYADSLLPATLPAAGGTVTISGMGFRIGNRVTVNGVPATVQSWTSNSILVTMPTMAAAQAVNLTSVDVEVYDVSSGATSTMTGALTYDTAATLPNMMALLSAEQANSYVGSVAPVPFTVRVLKADGVTAVAGDPVVFSATAGTVLFSACGAAVCTVTTDATGTASTGVTPQAVGAVTMQAVDGALSQSASFVAMHPDGSMIVTSAPSGAQANGSATQPWFQVRILAADGSSGVSGRLVTFTVTSGTAEFGPCLQAMCGAVTDSNGYATVAVAPLALGTVTVQASDGALTQSATFQSVSSLDVMQVVSAAQPTAVVGQSAIPFTVLLLHADGVTPDGQEPIVFTASGGATLFPCATPVCRTNTGWNGQAGVELTAPSPGTYTVQAAYGGAMQTATTTYVSPVNRMVLLSSPSPLQPVGVMTDKPFSVQVLWADGSPMTNVPLPMYGPLDQEVLGACGRGACLLYTDGNGIATSTVTTLRAGPIVLTADYGTLNQTVTFSAVGSSDTLTVLASPAAGSFTGDVESFLVQVTLPDGVTPGAGKVITFTATAGSFAFLGCGTPCTVVTGANGEAAMTGVALSPGLVTVVAADGAVAQGMSFLTDARADVMRLIGGPSGSAAVGMAAPTAFAVQVFTADGVTPAVGRTITFAVTVGSSQFSACPAAPCVATSDANGMATTLVTPLLAGATSVVAADGAASQMVSFTAVGPSGILSAVNPAVYVAAGATFSEALGAQATVNGTGSAGQWVSWSSAGAIQLGNGASTTNASGTATIPARIGSLAGGATATATVCAWVDVCANFQAVGVAASSQAVQVESGGAQSVAAGGQAAPVAAQVSDGAGHGVAGATVTVYQTVSAVDVACPTRGRCPAQPVLQSSVSTAISDGNGQIEVVPLMVSGVAAETKLLLTVGTQGTANATVQLQP